ncbi:MAG: hypothetical protein ACRCUY_08275 [Thermoguttaceae bacterium]
MIFVINIAKSSTAENDTTKNEFSDYIRFVKYGKSGKWGFSEILAKFFGFLLLVFGIYILMPSFLMAELTTAENETNKLESESLDWSQWETDYETALALAQSSSKNLLIYFHAENDSPSLLNESEEKFVPINNNSTGTNGPNTIRQVVYLPPSEQRSTPIAVACRQFEKESLANRDIQTELQNYVLLRLSHNATILDENGEEISIFDLPRFSEMVSLPGLAILDFTHHEESYYGEIVGILPFLRGKPPKQNETLTFLTLPAGTLTQRTLIYAVRIHPERPRSADGDAHPVLLGATQEHSAYQAKTGVLGHQNFGARGQRVASQVGISSPSEVCAQSWSGEHLLEAAIGCVRAWRGSSAHWTAVRAPHKCYGYDMVRGRNGTWYATGIFLR